MRRMVRGALALGALTLAFYQGTEVVRAQVALSDADEVLVMVNQARAEAGVPPLRANAALQTAAQSWAQYMALNNYLNHIGRNGSTPADRMAAAGYQGGTTGENLAKGLSNPISVMNAWLHSSSHRVNILNPNFTDLGVGVYTSAYGIFWVQNFGGGSAEQPAAQVALPPAVSTIAPAFARMGEDVLIIGQRFGGEPGSVMFSGGLTGEIQDWNDRAIRVTVPYGASTGMVYVQNPAGTSPGTFLYVQPPLGDESIFVPTPAPMTPPATPTPPTPPAPTPSTPSVPSRTPQTAQTPTPQLPLTSPPATGRTTVSREPNLMSLSPGSGKVGDAVILVGNWYSYQPRSVTFNGVNAPILGWDATSVSVRVPTGATSGPVQLRTDAGSSNVLTFTVITSPITVRTLLPVSTPPPPVTAPPPPVTTPSSAPAPRSTPTLTLPSRVRLPASTTSR
jgi:hypothetical protein